MKRSIWSSVWVGISFLPVLFLPGFVTNARGDQERNETIVTDKAGDTSAAKVGYSEEKEKFKRETRKTLAKLDRKMDALEAKAKETGSKVKAEAKDELRELKTKRAEIKKDMEKLEASSKGTWEVAKNKVKKEIDELETKFDTLRSKFD